MSEGAGHELWAAAAQKEQQERQLDNQRHLQGPLHRHCPQSQTKQAMPITASSPNLQTLTQAAAREPALLRVCWLLSGAEPPRALQAAAPPEAHKQAGQGDEPQHDA